VCVRSFAISAFTFVTDLQNVYLSLQTFAWPSNNPTTVIFKEDKRVAPSFLRTVELMQKERKEVLYSSCQRLNPDFRGFSDKPSVNSMYSDKYKVR